jgi:hypothetical protein
MVMMSAFAGAMVIVGCIETIASLIRNAKTIMDAAAGIYGIIKKNTQTPLSSVIP